MTAAQRIITAIILLAACAAAEAQRVYTPSDSTCIEKVLNECGQSASTLDIASHFMGRPYVASTLDSCTTERLVVNTRAFDCTTFVETITAIALTARSDGQKNFDQFCQALQLLRYRGGLCSGYASRLHYISQWITDSAKKGKISEIITDAHTATQRLSLNFMSSHPTAYPQLKADGTLIPRIREHENPFCDTTIKYIPKSALNGGRDKLGIEDGDILALVTAIEGLDVSHIGFAKWIDGRLHLVHASSVAGATIVDEQTLYDYMRTKKKSLGVRLFRLQK